MYARNKKTGHRIVAIVERIEGTAGLMEDGFSENADGDLDYEYDGGTKFDWDAQHPVIEDGHKVYVDEEGNHVPENGIRLADA